ncbi:hypothetical protein J6590_023283 [Homalodisca vitripennis]|nr:hypothetical protein J6590_023279 [Homalodisca vitripennis]KAG8298029.1 hypothetical protein J6590_023283 [Homalodisca vitripennis]
MQLIGSLNDHAASPHTVVCESLHRDESQFKSYQSIIRLHSRDIFILYTWLCGELYDQISLSLAAIAISSTSTETQPVVTPLLLVSGGFQSVDDCSRAGIDALFVIGRNKANNRFDNLKRSLVYLTQISADGNTSVPSRLPRLTFQGRTTLRLSS